MASYKHLDIEHGHYSGHEGVSGVFLEPVAVRFWNHFIAYHVEHGASGQCSERRKQSRRYIADKISGNDPGYLEQSHCERYSQHSPHAHPYHYKGCDNDHALWYVLNGYGDGYSIGVGEVVAVEYHSGCNTLGKFVYGYCYDEQQYAIYRA